MPITRGTLISSSDPRTPQHDRRLLSLKVAWQFAQSDLGSSWTHEVMKFKKYADDCCCMIVERQKIQSNKADSYA